MSNWIVKKIEDENIKRIESVAREYKISNFLAKVLVNRNIDDENIKYMLSDNINDIIDPKHLSDIDEVCKLIKKYIDEKKKIRIVGDYDVDGVCATYILYDGIKNLGGEVSYRIPERIKDGYGININIIDECIKDKIDLIITCDNGISQVKEIEHAKNNGIEVIITDHHEIPSDPIKNVLIINPKRKDVKDPYPFSEICGATVAYKTIIYLYKLYDNKTDVISKFLPFSMIATVCDIMPIINENHIIVKTGLNEINNTTNKGLKKLLYITNLIDKKISYYHIGFIIGPLINASGRLESATLSLKLFLSEDNDEISELSYKLKELNDERKSITIKGTELALDEVINKYSDDKILVLYLKDVKEQVAGIVAGRVKDTFNKPTIIVTDSNEENILKASCRSIEQYDIFSNLERHKELFVKFGGHKLAAGFSMKKENLDILRKSLNEESTLTKKDFVKTIKADDILNIGAVNINMVDEIEKVAPFGHGYERPNYIITNVKINVKNLYGVNKNIARLSIYKDNCYLEAVSFDYNEEMKSLINNNDLFNILFYMDINEFNGNRKLELRIIDIKVA